MTLTTTTEKALLQSSHLLSDMKAFKAANPDAQWVSQSNSTAPPKLCLDEKDVIVCFAHSIATLCGNQFEGCFFCLFKFFQVDFVRWFSPTDWNPQQLINTSNVNVESALSERMRQNSGVWEKLWKVCLPSDLNCLLIYFLCY
jgi:hypothetical protein